MIRLSLSFFCGLNISTVMLFASASSFLVIWSISYLTFTLGNSVWCWSLYLIIVSYISPQYFSFAFTIHACLYVAPRFLKNSLMHSYSIKYPGALIASISKLSVTEGSSYFVYFTLLIFASWTVFDSLSYVEHVLTLTLFYWLSLTLTIFDSILSVEQPRELLIFYALIFCVIVEPRELLIFRVILFSVLKDHSS